MENREWGRAATPCTILLPLRGSSAEAGEGAAPIRESEHGPNGPRAAFKPVRGRSADSGTARTQILLLSYSPAPLLSPKPPE